MVGTIIDDTYLYLSAFLLNIAFIITILFPYIANYNEWTIQWYPRPIFKIISWMVVILWPILLIFEKGWDAVPLIIIIPMYAGGLIIMFKEATQYFNVLHYVGAIVLLILGLVK